MIYASSRHGARAQRTPAQPFRVSRLLHAERLQVPAPGDARLALSQPKRVTRIRRHHLRIHKCQNSDGIFTPSADDPAIWEKTQSQPKPMEKIIIEDRTGKKRKRG
jgi:hypothetical protein